MRSTVREGLLWAATAACVAAAVIEFVRGDTRGAAAVGAVALVFGVIATAVRHRARGRAS